MVSAKLYDMLVIGGGINGVGIARDASGRGLSVLLCEQDDLSGHTSSASTKLIHGGLRYLEYYEFNLVRKALEEREVLLRAAPHIIWPLRFVMPHNAGLRPAWLIRLGLFLYDHLARRELLPGSGGVNLSASPLGRPLQPGLSGKGFVYSDAWVDDARLVMLNAMDAAERGATILPRTRCVSVQRHGDRWDVTLQSVADGSTQVVKARVLVNAAGPWAVNLLRSSGMTPKRNLLMAKGSHIVVRRLFDHDHAYLLQNPDKRIIFAIPYERDFTLIGTTDVEYQGDPADAAISESETAYLCEMANRYFRQKISPADVVWSYSGVRPLLEDDATDISAVTRDYLLDYDADDTHAPLLSVFGGKITTYRRLAEEAMDLLAPRMGGVRPAWTARAPLPGGDIVGADFDGFIVDLQRHYPWLPDGLRRRYARAYGTRIHRLLGDATSLADLGEDLGDGLYEAECLYLVRNEWAQTADDILWRRSKLGLHVKPETARRLSALLPSLLVDSRKQEIRHAADA